MESQDGFPPPTGQQPYGTPPLGQQPYNPIQEPVKSNGKIIIGFISAAISLVLLPILFGPLAILLGYLAKKDGDSRGQALLITGIVCMILGFALAAIFVLSQS